ncbi:twin-arginine translocase TatA/TatE family subunit [Streptomyces sp. NPDC101062]|uniref:twin-arginine translocase TatA/TatE family subunit n=1 Tax=unclassified Streptomyces TaxID=2593676 RepID=UPI002E7851F1|nr:twin-arginine translocase TatA/TatE family subunit [Streptomyces sp. JV176]MEE1799770.1 twin-arginine translocase TatA/TatE family subunit [Streptomyces sp. JV176]
MFGLSELAVILIIIAVVVGVKKLPELARSAGKAARILKSETKALKEEGKADSAAPGTAPQDGAQSGSPGGAQDNAQDNAQGGRRIVTGTIVEPNEPPKRP